MSIKQSTDGIISQIPKKTKNLWNINLLVKRQHPYQKQATTKQLCGFSKMCSEEYQFMNLSEIIQNLKREDPFKCVQKKN